MTMQHAMRNLALAAAGVLVLQVTSAGQQREQSIPSAHLPRINFERTELSADSRLFDVTIRDDAEHIALPVRVPGTMLLRLEFTELHLGPQDGVWIEALEDGGGQWIGGPVDWEQAGRSAMFNGDGVEVQLYRTRGSSAYFRIGAVLSRRSTQASDEEESFWDCNSDVGKVPSSDNRVCRLWIASGIGYYECTAWRVINGSFVTAGHCAATGALDFVEFNVPASLGDGSPVVSAPQDQFDVDDTTVTWMFEGIGEDWAVFGVRPNSTTGHLPHEIYGIPFRVTREAPAHDQIVRVTGFGADDGQQNVTNQTAIGPYKDEYVGGPNDIDHEYYVSTSEGNSGSPIIWEANGLAIGVNTHRYCGPWVTDSSLGTSCEVDVFEAAMANFGGSGVVYADSGHPLPVGEDGTLYRPFNTVAEAVAAAAPAGIVSIVAGSYPAAAGNVFVASNPLTIRALCGSVVIGN